MSRIQKALMEWGLTLCTLALALNAPIPVPFILGLIALLFVCRIIGWALTEWILERLEK